MSFLQFTHKFFAVKFISLRATVRITLLPQSGGLNGKENIYSSPAITKVLAANSIISRTIIVTCVIELYTLRFLSNAAPYLIE